MKPNRKITRVCSYAVKRSTVLTYRQRNSIIFKRSQNAFKSLKISAIALRKGIFRLMNLSNTLSNSYVS